MIHLDTHILVWLQAGLVDKLAGEPARLIEANACVASPMALLELDLLHEIGRLSYGADRVLRDLSASLRLRVSDAPFAHVAAEASRSRFTRDPFDRMICAAAKVDGCALLTFDRQLLEHCAHATR